MQLDGSKLPDGYGVFLDGRRIGCTELRVRRISGWTGTVCVVQMRGDEYFELVTSWLRNKYKTGGHTFPDHRVPFELRQPGLGTVHLVEVDLDQISYPGQRNDADVMTLAGISERNGRA